MQKTIIVLLVLVALAVARPQQEVTIVNQEEHNNIGIGGYRFSYEQSDGQKREETAELLNEGTENELMKVSGSYSFVFEGKTYRVDFTADENGYQPKVSIV